MRDEPFPPQVHEVLTASGWYPGRRRNLRRYLRKLKRVGYPVHAAAEATLSELFGIVASRKRSRDSFYIERAVSFGTFRNRLALFGFWPLRRLLRADWPARYWRWKAPHDGLFLSEYFECKACLIGAKWERWRPMRQRWLICGGMYMLDDGRVVCNEAGWEWLDVTPSLGQMLEAIWFDVRSQFDRSILDACEVRSRLWRYGLKGQRAR
jgi:hypothetical protein